MNITEFLNQFPWLIKAIKTIPWSPMINIILSLVFFVVTIKLSKAFLNKFFDRLKLKSKDIDSEKNLDTLKLLAISTANIIIFTFVTINILNILGVDVRPIITAAGVVGVAVGFGSKKFVEDLISGLTIILEGQVRVGDTIEIQGITGTVEKVTLCLIIMRSIDGAVHYIRNGMIDKITNYSRDYAYAVMDITVAYKENIAKVIETIKELGNEFVKEEGIKNKVLGDIEIWGLDSFNDSSITIKYRIKTLTTEKFTIKREFNLRIKEKFDEVGIEIPFNQLVITQQ